MITIKNLQFRSLSIDELTISPGFTTIIGANGSGKTTFLKLCAGIIVPDSGSILIDGIPPREIETGWVNEFPDRNILFIRVADEIASPLMFRFIPCAIVRVRILECAAQVGISHLLHRQVRELSGGEKVLVSLAAALIHMPVVLVLDEYDSHLDAARSDHIDQLIRQSGIKYVLRCSQQMDLVTSSDHVLLFEDGKVTCTGTPDQVFASLQGSEQFPFFRMPV
jgi:energy-coupling factor transport system ATP-binding protein